MPAGRPPEYKPEYCQMLIDHMSKGLSYETFSAEIDTSRTTLYNWEKQHPEFLDAKRKAFEVAQHFWETQGINGMWESKFVKLNSAVWIFNMKNRFKWKDSVEVEAGEETKNLIKLAYKL